MFKKLYFYSLLFIIIFTTGLIVGVNRKYLILKKYDKVETSNEEKYWEGYNSGWSDQTAKGFKFYAGMHLLDENKQKICPYCHLRMNYFVDQIEDANSEEEINEVIKKAKDWTWWEDEENS